MNPAMTDSCHESPVWGDDPMRGWGSSCYSPGGMAIRDETLEAARGRGRRSRHAIGLFLLWLAELSLIAIDIASPRDLSLLGYFLLPALVAAIYAPPSHVAWLALAALAGGVASGLHFDTLDTVSYLARLGAVASLGFLAVILSQVRRQDAAAVLLERNRFRATLDSLFDPHVLLRAVRDQRGRITDFVFTDANDAACRYNRLSRRQLLGRHLMELLPAHASTGLLDLYRRALESGRPLALDNYLYPHDILEKPRYYDIRAAAIGDELSYTWRDVTARHTANEQLQHRARTDELTKLLNRREVFDRLRDLHGKTPRTGHGLAVLFVDFDKFKSINDTHGHAAGDEVLRITADRIRSCLRHDDDLGARVGGDEMMVVLHGVHGLADAEAVAEKLRALAAQPVRFNGSTIPATVSIGVALAHPEESPEALVARADEAMYRAKQLGRNQVVTINGNP
jgi:diguanylate cyclase (GGDEF)-like protein